MQDRQNRTHENLCSPKKHRLTRTPNGLICLKCKK